MFKILDETCQASPQISVRDVEAASGLGIGMIVNNRPEGESDDQTPGAEIEAAARAAGMDYVAIPVTHAGFSQGQVDAMLTALEGAKGKVLAYCRSGTRSTLLWALACSKAGDDPAKLAQQAAQAGYDVSPIRQLMDMLASGER